MSAGMRLGLPDSRCNPCGIRGWDSGQLVTASLMDYAVPGAADSPSFAFETRNVRTTVNPLGVKGAGEAAPSARRRR